MSKLETTEALAVVVFTAIMLIATSVIAAEVPADVNIGNLAKRDLDVVQKTMTEKFVAPLFAPPAKDVAVWPAKEAMQKKVAIGISPEPNPERTLSYKPGQVIKDCEFCPEMVVIPAGEFTMGSPASEEGRYGDESPQHKVTIRKPFAIGKFEITFDEWDACVAAGGCNDYTPDDRGWGRGRRPVIDISWPDANSYVTWLSQKTGKNYRLLTEAEWEYAARVGSKTPYYTGKTITTEQANFNGDLDYHGTIKTKKVSHYREETLPVGSFPPNAFGLYDMHGNVWEWVEDCWNDSYHGAPINGSAWTSGICSLRVLRGGSWKENPRDLRSAVRGGDFAAYRDFSFGLRVARTLD